MTIFGNPKPQTPNPYKINILSPKKYSREFSYSYNLENVSRVEASKIVMEF